MDGCCYKSTGGELSTLGCTAVSSTSPASAASCLLLDQHQQQRQHAAAPGSMLPSFGFTQEQVRESASLSINAFRSHAQTNRRDVSYS